MGRWVDTEWMDGWVDGWMNGWRNGLMDEWVGGFSHTLNTEHHVKRLLTALWLSRCTIPVGAFGVSQHNPRFGDSLLE